MRRSDGVRVNKVCIVTDAGNGQQQTKRHEHMMEKEVTASADPLGMYSHPSIGNIKRKFGRGMLSDELLFPSLMVELWPGIKRTYPTTAR